MRPAAVWRTYVLAWLLDGLFWLASSFVIAALASLALVLIYAISLVNPFVVCPTCEGSREHVKMGWLMGLFPGVRSRGCRSKHCVNGRRIRWGVRVLQPGRAAELRSIR